MKILLFMAQGFETMEFSPFVDVFGWARNDYGYDVSVSTCGFRKKVMSSFHIPVLVDKTIDEVNINDYDALAVPGGFEEYGFYEEAYDARFLSLIRAFHESRKWIAAICVGALPLGKSGILTGRHATTYHLGDGKRQAQLSAMGAKVVDEPIVID
ncbi:DJ-1/PfpI family protein [Sporolactobacillus sp. CPB3-1]|uniref:DJ-1/PfpI family protein n=1 Tax=Sporolactobacillus mangiferae TaxID=2940498 RepID=A0ABT0MAY2_9BACL|nr:DJ-1/PfpI family protein [Sporolactobacillus mangiferae]MCL1632019.1 DJ-1/PfpI family protein [Sporolactobacillus mangiferae]